MILSGMASDDAPILRPALRSDSDVLLDLPGIIQDFGHSAGVSNNVATQRLVAQYGAKDIVETMIRRIKLPLDTMSVVLARPDSAALIPQILQLKALDPALIRYLYQQGHWQVLRQSTCPEDVLLDALNGNDMRAQTIAQRHPAAMNLMTADQRGAALNNPRTKAVDLLEAAKNQRSLEVVVAHHNTPAEALALAVQARPDLAPQACDHYRCPPEVLREQFQRTGDVHLLAHRNMPAEIWQGHLNNRHAWPHLAERTDLSTEQIAHLVSRNAISTAAALGMANVPNHIIEAAITSALNDQWLSKDKVEWMDRVLNNPSTTVQQVQTLYAAEKVRSACWVSLVKNRHVTAQQKVQMFRALAPYQQRSPKYRGALRKALPEHLFQLAVMAS